MDRNDAQHSALTRRDFLKRGSASLAGAALLGAPPASSRAAASSAPTELVFTFGPDDSGTLPVLIDAFNRQHAGDIHVRWRKMPRSSGAHFRQLQADFESDAPQIDVLGADVVWTAEFAHSGWVTDLSRRFYNAYDPDDFLHAALDAASHQFRIWGIPWFTDVGMLYYRRDLLMRNDFTNPPQTWDALKEMTHRIQRYEDVEHGFVFQGDADESGVANACEYIWNAGGHIMTNRPQIAGMPGEGVLDPNVVNVHTPEAARGFDIARRMISEGAAPAEITRFREQDTLDIFLRGEAVFMRNWPFAYALVNDPERSELAPEQVGVTAIPAADANRRRYSCLGGWNLMISAHTSPAKREAAWTFIQFVTAPNQQKNRALGGGFLPTLHTLYDDPEVVGAVPIIDLGRSPIQNARSRPSSPYYSQMSPHIADAFTRTLRGEITSEDAVSRLERDLQAVLERNR